MAVPQSRQGAGYLGVRYAAFATNATPRKGQPFAVRGMALDGSLSLAQVDRRHELLRDLDSTFQEMASDSQLVEGLDSF